MNMNKIVLLGLLTLYGSLILAMAPDFPALLQDALGDATKVEAFTQAIKEHKRDIDTDKYASNITFTRFLEGRKHVSAHMRATVERIFADVMAHRSHPEGASKLRSLLHAALADEKNILALEQFLEGNSFNIDRIDFNPAHQGVSIGSWLDSHRPQGHIKKILNLPRITLFRYKDTSLEELNDLLDDAINLGQSHFAVFDKLYTDMVTRGLNFERSLVVSRKQSLCDLLSKALAEKDDKAGALLIAERVQGDRTNKTATIGALFKAFEKDSRYVEYLIRWFKKFPIDIDTANYEGTVKIGARLNALIKSTDPARQKAALLVASVVRPYRTADIKVFNALLEAYKKDTTKLAALKEWFEKNPFDIDSAPVDLTKPNGEKLGEVLKDAELSAFFKDALSDFFKDTPSKVPVSNDMPRKDSSWLTRNMVITVVGVLAVTAFHLWKNRQMRQQTSTEELAAT